MRLDEQFLGDEVEQGRTAKSQHAGECVLRRASGYVSPTSAGTIGAGSGAFTVAARFPSLRGEAPGTTTPEELLAASHAVCYGIGLRSVIGRRGGSAAWPAWRRANHVRLQRSETGRARGRVLSRHAMP